MATLIKGKNPLKPYTIRYQDPNKGSQHEKSFARRSDALDFKASCEYTAREGTFVDPRAGKIVFVDYARQWIASQPLADGTKEGYLSAISAIIAPAIGTRTLAQVANDREAVQDIIAGMTQGASRKASVLGVIVGACNEAVTAGKIAKHRLASIPVQKDAIQPATIIPVTEAQLEIMAHTLRPEEALTVWLMRGTGLRVSEALAVKISGFRNGTLRVCEQVKRGGGTAPLKRRRPGESRVMPIPSWLMAKVNEHVATFGTDDGYLFGKDGRRLQYASYHSRFIMAACKARLVGLTEHGLRHLYASTLLHAGVPITDVAMWLGHRDISITFAVYGHLLPDSWDRGREALESCLAA